MSAIPPDIIGSAIQAGFTQREASRVQEADRAGQSHAARNQAKAVDEAASNVDTSDEDTHVFTDAEGSGGQGRNFEESPDDEQEANLSGPAEGLELDNSPAPESQNRLDIQA